MSTRKFNTVAGLLSGWMTQNGIKISANGDYNAFSIPSSVIGDIKQYFLDDPAVIAEQADSNRELFEDLLEFRNIIRMFGVCSPGGGCALNGQTNDWQLATIYGPKIRLATESVKSKILKDFELGENDLPDYGLVLSFANVNVPLTVINEEHGLWGTLSLGVEGLESAKVSFEAKMFGNGPQGYRMPLATVSVGKGKSSDQFIARIDVKKKPDGKTDVMMPQLVIDKIIEGKFDELIDVVGTASTGMGWSYKMTDDSIPFGRFPIVGAYINTSGQYDNNIFEVECLVDTGEVDADGNNVFDKTVYSIKMNRSAEQTVFSGIEPLFNPKNPMGKMQHSRAQWTKGVKNFLVYYGVTENVQKARDGGEDKVFKNGEFCTEQLIPGEAFEFSFLTKDQVATYNDREKYMEVKSLRQDALDECRENDGAFDPKLLEQLNEFLNDDSDYAYIPSIKDDDEESAASATNPKAETIVDTTPPIQESEEEPETEEAPATSVEVAESNENVEAEDEEVEPDPAPKKAKATRKSTVSKEADDESFDPAPAKSTTTKKKTASTTLDSASREELSKAVTDLL